jgi:GTP-binding nuclear protein Ran
MQHILICVNAFGVCSDPNLHFVEAVALKPPEVPIDLAMQQQ